MKTWLLVFAILLYFTPTVAAEKAPSLPPTAKLYLETRMSDEFRTRLWCSLYEDTDSLNSGIAIWYVCRTHPHWAIILITYTDNSGNMKVAWKIRGYVKE
jgi:hypothetical protein